MQENNQKEKSKRGRPKWQPTDLEEVERLASRGLTQEQIAASLGISYQTLNERKKEFPDFADIIKRGGDRADAAVINALFENATTHNNTTAQIFWLKARLNWIEKSQVITEQNVKFDTPLEQIKQRIADTVKSD